MRVPEIRDLDTAREVTRLLEQEVARLSTKVAELTKELAKLRGQEGSRQLEIELVKLREQNALLRHALYGRSSEKRPRPGGAGDEEKDEKPQPGHGPRPQPELPEITEDHPLDGKLGRCKLCGKPVEEWPGQFEESEEISVIARQFVRIRHRRARARCQCRATYVTASAPPRLIPGGRYSIEFAVDVAVSKYLDHLPLNRQAGIMQREGLAIDSQTLWDQIEALARHLEPTYQALRGYVVAKPLLHADETPWYLLDEKPAKKWYVWCVAVGDAAYYWIRDGRGADEAREVLGTYHGIVVADGYKAYEALATEKKTKKKVFTLVYCWSHVRRKIREAEKFYPEVCRPALDLIGALYAVESEVPKPGGLEGKALAAALRLRARLRNEHSRPLVDKIKAWTQARPPEALPESALAKAIDYTVGLWPGLILFLENPIIPLDNNTVERDLRGPVVGRKNHYGSRSRRGTEVSALFYSVLETAKLVDVEPKAYLQHAARIAIERPGSSVFPHELLEPADARRSRSSTRAGGAAK
jgi:transposase